MHSEKIKPEIRPLLPETKKKLEKEFKKFSEPLSPARKPKKDDEIEGMLSRSQLFKHSTDEELNDLKNLLEEESREIEKELQEEHLKKKNIH